MAYIVRLDHKSTHGWQVRAGPPSGQLTRMFSDRKHGGREQSEAAALAALAALAAKAPPERPTFGARAKAQSNNSSGVVGVRPVYRRGSSTSENVYLYIQASWSVRGTPCCTAYSVNKHGLLGAVQLALERRKAVTGHDPKLTPCQAWYRMRHLAPEVNG